MKNEQERYINSVNLNQNTSFPYLVLNIIDENSYPRNPGFHVMHWHEDLQFIYVLSGQIEVVTLETSVPLQEGEGIFINKNVVHLVKKKSSSCHYNSFVFPDYFLKFYFGSPAGNMVEQVVGKEDFTVFRIENRAEHAAVLRALRKLSELERKKTPLYTYEVLTVLCSLWLELCRVIIVPEPQPEKQAIRERMAVFLRFIEQHYQESVSLEQLADSAHVSKSECLRCFKASLRTAPYQYLTEYRLSRAAGMLRSTDLPIGEIAVRVGFGQSSQFGKCFREKTGMTPGEYRRQAQTTE